MPEKTKIHHLAMMRCSVLLHGEKSGSPWWPSTAASSDAADIRFVFPRTAMTAAFSRAGELAKRLHDERTKQQGFYHLFRLPHAIEADIHRETVRLERAGELSTEKITTFFSGFLEGPSPASKATEGPVDCGKILLSKLSDLKRIGLLYKRAFDTDTICLPYFQLDA